MNPGRLRDRVTVERVTRTPDAGGGHTDDWAPVAEMWAEVLPLDGYEKTRAMSTGTGMDTRVTIRYRADITAADRLRDARGVLEIIAPPYAVDGRTEWLRMDCRRLS